MNKVSKLVWNLFRLVLAVGLVGLLVATGVFLFRGQFEAAVASMALMTLLFFSINVSNFWQYRWEEATSGARAVVVAPMMLAMVALMLTMYASAVVGLSTLGVIVVFWFLVTRRRQDLRFSRVPVQLQVDDERVGVAYGDVTLDSIQWKDVVRISAESDYDGPFDDELFVVLEDDDGDRCGVPLSYGTELLERLQKLDGFDNQQLGEALQQDDASLVLWEGTAGDARRCGR